MPELMSTSSSLYNLYRVANGVLFAKTEESSLHYSLDSVFSKHFEICILGFIFKKKFTSGYKIKVELGYDGTNILYSYM
jgi:hypothetical protein